MINGLNILLIFAVTWLFLILIYLVPTIIAFRRAHPNRWLILAVNVFLGATGIGWGVTLVWALRVAHLPGDDIAAHGGESGLNIFANDERRVRLTGPVEIGHDVSDSTLSATKTVAQIQRIQALRAAGHLSEEEYLELKSQAFSRFSGDL